MTADDDAPPPAAVSISSSSTGHTSAQLVAATAPEDEPMYIFPRSGEVLLGGTYQERQWNTDPSPSDAKAIVDRCNLLVPGVSSAPVVKHWVGLRPVRHTVRVELFAPFKLGSNSSGRTGPIVIHNYGHGGAALAESNVWWVHVISMMR